MNETQASSSIRNFRKATATMSEAANQTIVQCPSCQTRFAVDSEAVAELEFPKFHCSRCDQVFSLDESTYDGETEGAARQESLRPPQAFPSAQKKNHSLEIPAEVAEDMSLSAPQEHLDDDNLTQIEFDFADEPRKFGHSLVDDDEEKSDADFVIRQTKKPSDLVEPVAQELFQTSRPLPPRETPPVRGWRAAVILGSPIILFLCLAVGLAYYIEESPLRFSKLVDPLLPNVAQPAPAGLHIKNAKLKMVLLDSGETVPLIVGTVVNNTEQSFQEIVLEGFLFDSFGRKAGEALISSGSTLTKTRLKSLTPEMIQSLQSGKMARRFQLSSGKKGEFAIALLGSDPASAKSYSVRIYSVQPF